MELYDVAVVGGGPAGLSAAIVLGRARRKVVVVDSGDPRNRRARQVNGYLGLSEVSPSALRAKGELQARNFGVHFIDGLVASVTCPTERQSDTTPTVFHLQVQDGPELSARKLVFATGIRDQVPTIAGFAECYGISVHHCPYCDGWEHRDGRLVAFSESIESAIALATTLLRWSDQVTVATNGSYLSESDRLRLDELSINVREPRLESLEHDAGKLRALAFSSGQHLEADALFFAAPASPCCEIPVHLGCHTTNKDRIETTDRQGTGVPGVFLAGDADGEVQFVIVAAAEGATAGMAANKELQQEDIENRRRRPDREALTRTEEKQ
jgi:thioredoxin reductase